MNSNELTLFNLRHAFARTLLKKARCNLLVQPHIRTESIPKAELAASLALKRVLMGVLPEA